MSSTTRTGVRRIIFIECRHSRGARRGERAPPPTSSGRLSVRYRHVIPSTEHRRCGEGGTGNRERDSRLSLSRSLFPVPDSRPSSWPALLQLPLKILRRQTVRLESRGEARDEFLEL